MKLEILYQDEYLVAINKPSGLLVHRSEIDRHETAFALQLVRNQIGQRVYPVHRLDKPTSGVLLFALNSETASLMVEQWRQRDVEKRYLAITRGYMPEHVHLDHAMSPPVDKHARNERVKPPQEAITDFRCLAKAEIPVEIDKYPQSRYSLTEAMPKTGRKPSDPETPQTSEPSDHRRRTLWQRKTQPLFPGSFRRRKIAVACLADDVLSSFHRREHHTYCRF